VEDQATGKILKDQFDLAVLATGMVPNTPRQFAVGLGIDDNGFVLGDQGGSGMVGAGCAKQPVDVATSAQDATAAALKAIQATCRR
jgi:quinone-modifying oxidoreductase subunit QmoA